MHCVGRFLLQGRGGSHSEIETVTAFLLGFALFTATALLAVAILVLGSPAVPVFTGPIFIALIFFGVILALPMSNRGFAYAASIFASTVLVVLTLSKLVSASLVASITAFYWLTSMVQAGSFFYNFENFENFNTKKKTKML